MIRRVLRQHDEGALLLILMVAVAVMSIGVGVAAQAWSSTWRRDSEEELIFRGGQYVGAIHAYRKEHGGQLPTDLTLLMKPGPRQLRYIRKLYRDPINPTGQWGLLYLMPGAQAIYDAVLAQKQKGATGTSEGDVAFGSMPGVTPIAYNPQGMPGANLSFAPGAPGGPGGPAGGGLGGAGGPPVPGKKPFPAGAGSFDTAGQHAALSGGGAGATVGAPAPKAASGEFSDEEPSEPPIGWPIVGVISRAPDRLAAKTFKLYKGHEQVDEWQFHVFEWGMDQQQLPQGTVPRGGPKSIGPGHGGKGPFGGIGGTGPSPYVNKGGNWRQQQPPQQ